MSAQLNSKVPSDTEGEQPMREKLRRATIDIEANVAQKAAESETTLAETGETSDSLPQGEPINTEEPKRERLHRKRSFDETENEPVPDAQNSASARQPRKRSRDGMHKDTIVAVPEGPNTEVNDGTVTNGSKASTDSGLSGRTSAESNGNDTSLTGLSSPKTKRTRVAEKETEGDIATENTDVPRASLDNEKESRTGDIKPEVTEKQGNASKGFSDTSAASPFASAANSKAASSQQPQAASETAFKSSGFGALSSSSTSGFGSLGKNTGLSSFASPSPAPAATAAKEEKPKSSFGGALGAASPFASTGPSVFGSGSSSGFGKLGGSGFGSGGGFGGGSKLSSFASPIGGASLSNPTAKSSKPFGATADDDDDGEDGDDADDDKPAGIKSPLAQDEDKKDERFYAQDVETGEENEATEYTCRAKLYHFVPSDPADPASKKEWKERGLGTLRLNVQTPAASTETDEASEETDVEAGSAAGSKPKARLVMRADGSHRVILNSPVKKELRFGDVDGNEPKGQYVHFMGSTDVGGSGKLEVLQMKMRPQFALELYEQIKSLQEAM